jgi:hypothetical protein
LNEIFLFRIIRAFITLSHGASLSRHGRVAKRRNSSSQVHRQPNALYRLCIIYFAYKRSIFRWHHWMWVNRMQATWHDVMCCTSCSMLSVTC